MSSAAFLIDAIQQGHGAFSSAAKELGIISEQAELHRDRPPFVELVAPFPLGFQSLKQTTDRTAIEFTLSSGRLVAGSALVLLENGPKGGRRWEIPLPAGGGKVTPTIPFPDGAEQAKV